MKQIVQRHVGSTYALDIRWAWSSIPGLALMLVGFVLPTAVLGFYSVLRDGSNGQLIFRFTAENYVRILSDPMSLGVLQDTLLLSLLVTTICACIGYPHAYFLARVRSRWRSALIFLTIAPLMVSSVIRNIGWIPILGDYGAINTLLMRLHVTDSPLILMNNLTGVVIGLVHTMLPFMTLMLMNVIQRIDVDLEEAAQNLGASRWHCFESVVLPLSLRGLGAGCLLVFTITASSYATPLILGGGRVLVMATFISQQIQAVLRYAFGSALTIVLFATALGLTVLASKWTNRRGAVQ
jgi:putative spermidine/putrescine transport system permease protein